MTILADGGNQVESLSKRGEICKPDYEGQIETARVKVLSAESLETAIFNYLESHNMMHRGQNELAQMLGDLAIEKKQLGAAIERLIEQQEMDA